jgi:hypothetical protein
MVVYVSFAGLVGWLFIDRETRAVFKAASKRYREELKAEEAEWERYRAIERLGIRERRGWWERVKGGMWAWPFILFWALMAYAGSFEREDPNKPGWLLYLEQVGASGPSCTPHPMGGCQEEDY